MRSWSLCKNGLTEWQTTRMAQSSGMLTLKVHNFNHSEPPTLPEYTSICRIPEEFRPFNPISLALVSRVIDSQALFGHLKWLIIVYISALPSQLHPRLTKDTLNLEKLSCKT